MNEIEKIIKEEIRFEKYKYNSLSFLKEELNLLYEFLLIKLSKENISVGEKNKIKKQTQEKLDKIYNDFYFYGKNDIEEQVNYLIELKDVKLDTEKIILGTLFGLTLLELINKQKNYQLNFLNKMINENKIEKDFIDGKNILNQNRTILGSFSKNLRQLVRNKENKKGIIGWRSIAVLDGKTTPICLKLHNKFYSKEKYKNREDIEDLPPRHLNCRSEVVAISDINVKDITIDEYFKKNKDEAIDILGKKRAELFFNEKIKFNSFLDIGNRLFSLEEIKQKLKE